MAPRSLSLLSLLAASCSPRPAIPEATPSVLLITIDTLRADHLGAYGDTKARTPSIDALAQSGVFFERAYTPAPITLPAHTSLMTGLIPPAHGVRGNGGFALGRGPATLAESMKARGRATAAFVGGFPLSRRFGLDRGFDVYDDTMSKAASVNYDFAERRASEVVTAAAGWLRETPGPVFLWVHLFDPHAPYDPPADFRTGDPYRDEIAAVDVAVGRIVGAWDARPGPTVVALTSDHGEAFGEHGEWSHSLFVYDTTLHVPLIIRAGPFKAGTRASSAVGLVDVAATLVEVSGGSSRGLPGVSLVSAVNPGAADRPLYAETLSPRLDFGWSDLRSWREAGFKWIRAPLPELYGLSEDPTEARNTAATDVTRARRLETALSRAIAKPEETSSRRAPDPEGSERLRSLGYVQSPGGAGSGADPKTKVELARRIAAVTGPFANWDEAIRAYEPLVALDPRNPLLNLRLGDALLRAGRAQAALIHFQRVVKGAPLTADAHVGYATALAQLGRMDEARKVLEAAVSVDPASGQVHYNLGEIARVEGRLADARREYEAATRDPATASRAAGRLRELR